MAEKIGNRVLETSTTTGTGTYTLLGAASGFQSFLEDNAITSGDTVLYTAFDAPDWEIGLGVFTSGGSDTLSRVTIIASSNADAAVNWSAGTRTIISSIPAEALAFFADRTATGGMLARTGAWAYALRTITGGAGITVTNGDGASASPDVEISDQTKGDLLGFQTSGALSVLAVGTAGQQLTSDAAEVTGLKWSPAIPDQSKGDLMGFQTSGALSVLSVGTNGQVLSADSAEVTGLKWSPAIPNQTKGDLLGFQTSGALSVLLVGSNLDALLADSSQTTGLRWGSVAPSFAAQVALGIIEL